MVVIGLMQWLSLFDKKIPALTPIFIEYPGPHPGPDLYNIEPPQTSTPKTTLSSRVHLYGAFNFDRMPLSLPVPALQVPKICLQVNTYIQEHYVKF